MGVIQVLLLFSLFTFSCQTPFIFEDNVQICSFTSRKKEEKIETVSNTVSIKKDQIELNFKLCGKFTNNNKHECPVETAVCLKNHKTGEKLNLGTEFVSDEIYDFKSINGESCTKYKKYSVVVHLECSKHMKVEAYLMFIEEKCTYHVAMRDPKCLPRCTTYINNNFIDLRELDRTFSVRSSTRNFSITLCKENRICGDDVNACEMIGDSKTPLSLASSISVSYVGHKNQLAFSGVTYTGKNNKIDTRFEIILKCNWDKKDIKNEDLQYVEKRQQGRKYAFKLETSFGCIKQPRSCVVYDQFLVYNLSGLYNEHQEMWSTHGTENNSGSVYFLQVCGPLELAGKNTSCKSTYAQVCENRNGIDINRGSVLRNLEVINDILRATVESGMQCEKMPDFQYHTIINFYCQEHEEGPTFLKQTDCDTFFTWRTPYACPHYNISSCSHVHEQRHNCSFQNGNNFYNLSELTKTQKSIKAENKEFLINVCGPVIDSKAPCMRDVSVALKNLTEFNPKHMIFSLGKFSGANKVENDSLILEYLTGSFCDGTDYRSKIRFECSDLQEEPMIIKQEKCFYEFLWRTKHACPKNIKEKPRNIRNCTYIDSYNNKSIDFGHIEKSVIELVDANKYHNYTFDLCQRNYTNCTYNGDGCQSVSIKGAVVESLHNSTILKFFLPTGCQRTDDFNKVTFRLFCDKVKFNDHIDIKETVNCSLMINLYTNFACSLKYDYIPVRQKEQPEPVLSKVLNPEPVLSKVVNFTSPKQDLSKVMNLTQPKQDLVETTLECFMKSPFTNKELNIKNFTFLNDFFKRGCPTVTFNETYRYIRLLYVTTDQCRPIPLKNLSYEVYLKCTNDKVLPVVNDVCLEHYNYEEQKYCNFFKPPDQYSSSSNSVLFGFIIGFLFLIVVASIVIYVVMRRNSCRTKRRGFVSIYQKDTEL